MSANDDLINAFVTGLELDSPSDVETLEYRGITEWDSIGHMSLIAEIENTFDVMLSTDQVIALSSFSEAKRILGDLGVAGL